ncbi:hypothetical protein J437_LFUL008474 [Ladona fulva]|uniref:DUF4745 domain-containing protein n=1 Tax=Ladona fulva TaxID=123851 RepID=A0A8K0K3V9_LADFU|nr:hypothetical protein J437_LFUL008474 [Ladona fulva]
MNVLFEKNKICEMSSVSVKDISECVSVWLSYLQMLNGLCSAGSRLSQGLQLLLGNSQGHSHATPMAAHCRAMWDDLARITAATTASVKSGVVAALQESALRINNSDASKQFEIGDVACASLTTFVNMQHQFCLACCEYLRGVKAPRGIAEPREECVQASCRPPLTPVQSCQQRRWSEEVAPKGRSASVPEADTGPRRWSMPWESGGSQANRLAPSAPPTFPPSLPLISSSGGAQPRELSHRSGSTTPDSMWQGSSLASMEDLQGVIHLLSCQPGTSTASCYVTHLHQPSRHIPGVTLTSCSLNEKDIRSSWDWGLEIFGAPTGSKYPCAEDTSVPADEEPNKLMSGAQNYVTNLLHPTVPNRSTPGMLNLPGLQPWCEGDAGNLPSNVMSSSGWTIASADGGVPSRKSSSSTDSSSTYSKSTGSGSEGESRSHLYCMWKGEAPFIQLTESLVEGDVLSDSVMHACLGNRMSSGKLEEEVNAHMDSQPPLVHTSFGEERISSQEDSFPRSQEGDSLVIKDRT